jgi:deoxycytidylate deaminase
VHAELNAALDVSDRGRLDGATLFVTEPPCDGCLKILRTMPFSRLVHPVGDVLTEREWPFM